MLQFTCHNSFRMHVCQLLDFLREYTFQTHSTCLSISQLKIYNKYKISMDRLSHFKRKNLQIAPSKDKHNIRINTLKIKITICQNDVITATTLSQYSEMTTLNTNKCTLNTSGIVESSAHDQQALLLV